MKIYIYLLITIAFSCWNTKKEDCILKDYMEIKLRPVNVSLKLPAYRIVDSLRFGKETVLSYNIKSIDSTVDAMALVSSNYDEDALADTNLNQRMYFQKETVEFGRQAQKLEEKIVDVDTTKVGFLKYLIKQKEKTFYEGRIFFYRGGNLVQIWLFEEHVSEQHNLHSAIDCIVQSIILE